MIILYLEVIRRKYCKTLLLFYQLSVGMIHKELSIKTIPEIETALIIFDIILHFLDESS